MIRSAEACPASDNFLLRCLCVFLGGCSLGSPALFADEHLSSVVRNVEGNEALYQNLDVKIRMHYDIGDRPPEHFSGGKEIVRKEVGTHFVAQEGMFRLQTSGGSFDDTDARTSRDKIRVFDGEQTKLLDRNLIGNLIAGRAEDSEFVRPHGLLLRYASLPVPLSVYLQGHAAINAMAGNDWLSGLELVVSYGGEEEFESLHCHKVVATMVLPGTDKPELTRTELWLAEARNFLPVRVLMWDLKRSADVPRVDGSVSELRELKPGIWFPVTALVTSYDPTTLELEGTQKIGWREQYLVESVSLDPQYELAYFRDLEFPVGTAVYEVENGKVKKAYHVGSPDSAEEPRVASGSHVWWLVCGNIVIAGILVVAALSRKRRAVKSGAASRTEAVA